VTEHLGYTARSWYVHRGLSLSVAATPLPGTSRPLLLPLLALCPLAGELGGALEPVGGLLVGHVVLARRVELGPEPVEQVGGLAGDGRVLLVVVAGHVVASVVLVAHARKHGRPQNRAMVR
jgi:hypothetical protein